MSLGTINISLDVSSPGAFAYAAPSTVLVHWMNSCSSLKAQFQCPSYDFVSITALNIIWWKTLSKHSDLAQMLKGNLKIWELMEKIHFSHVIWRKCNTFSDTGYSPFHHWTEELKGPTIYWACSMPHTRVSFNHYCHSLREVLLFHFTTKETEAHRSFS